MSEPKFVAVHPSDKRRTEELMPNAEVVWDLSVPPGEMWKFESRKEYLRRMGWSGARRS